MGWPRLTPPSEDARGRRPGRGHQQKGNYSWCLLLPETVPPERHFAPQVWLVICAVSETWTRQGGYPFASTYPDGRLFATALVACFVCAGLTWVGASKWLGEASVGDIPGRMVPRWCDPAQTSGMQFFKVKAG